MTRSAVAHDFDSFRVAARQLVAAGIRPSEVVWLDPAQPQAELFAETQLSDPPATQAAPRVPRRFVELAEIAALYRSPDRFDLLYRVLYRLTHGEPQLLEDEVDPDVRALQLRVQSVRKDEHRMHAFVRFRKLQLEAAECFVAWYAPEHHILRLAAPFFERRFAAMRWSILTPDESAHWNGETLQYGPGAPRSEAPQQDELETLFRTYYSATYNPARANLPLLRKHIPAAFARHMPELDRLPVLMQERAQTDVPTETDSAAPLVAAGADIPALREAARACLACLGGERAPSEGRAARAAPLPHTARLARDERSAACVSNPELGTQTVFGEGNTSARLCLIGEQPGDEEDRRGKPFVGPAGQVLDRALAEANVPREALYVTNAVKHFTYIYRGERRLHSKPSLRIVRACKPWLEAELKAVQPAVVLCLGATAAQSFMGSRFSITRNRGRVFETPWAKAFIVTYHPSAILRMEDGPAAQAYADLVADLKLAHQIANA